MINQTDFTEINTVLKNITLEENLLIVTEEYDKGGFFSQLLRNHLNLETLDFVTIQILEDFEYKDILEHPDGRDKFKLLTNIENLNIILNENKISKCLIHSTDRFFNNINHLNDFSNISVIYIKSI